MLKSLTNFHRQQVRLSIDPKKSNPNQYIKNIYTQLIHNTKNFSTPNP